jgi:hypothetical protein
LRVNAVAVNALFCVVADREYPPACFPDLPVAGGKVT